MSYRYYNANPRNKDTFDCTCRAISLVENNSWDYTYRKLSNLARRQGLMMDSVEFIECYLDMNYPRQCHNSITIDEFIDDHPRGTYICSLTGHVTAIIDGVCYDTFDPSDRIMRCAWRIK